METPFSGWREGMPYYLPLFAAALVLAFALRPYGYTWVAIPILIVACCIALFFRDFPRSITVESGAVVAPADGTLAAIEHLEETPHYDGACLRISIFMSVFNAHVNRAPCDCTVMEVRYAPGAFKNAMLPESSQTNESNAVWLDTRWGPVTVRQISGAVARRIVCRATPGISLTQGEKFGMIKFGSRVEVYLPPEAQSVASVNQKTRAGQTVIARFP
jgi:phosphatidylserine decarboxylase